MQIKITDDELIFLCRRGDPFANKIMEDRYYKFIKKWIYEFNGIKHSDVEHLTFIGTLCLKECIDSFEYCKGQFYSYFKICCKRKMLQEIERINKRSSYEVDMDLEEMGYLIFSEDTDTIFNHQEINFDKYPLNDLERKALLLKAKGLSYEAISKELNITKKKIDNCLQSAKKKINSRKK